MAFWSKKADAAPAAEVTPPAAKPVGPQPTAPARPPEPTQAAATAKPAPIAASPAAQAAAAPPRPELSPEAARKAAETSKLLMAAFGQITNVLMRSPQYRQHPLSDLEWLVVPAVMNGQFALAEARSKANGMKAPVAVLLWASVSAEIDKRLSETAAATPTRLKPEEWASGELLWVIDAVGEPDMVQAMLKRKMETDWKGQTAKMRVRDKAGVMRVGVLSAAAPATAVT